MSCFGSRFLLAKPAGCKVAGCAHPHPFAQVHRLMIEPDWLMKEPPAGSFLPSLPSKLRHRHPSSLTEVGWHEGSTERSPWRLAVLRKLWYKAVSENQRLQRHDSSEMPPLQYAPPHWFIIPKKEVTSLSQSKKIAHNKTTSLRYANQRCCRRIKKLVCYK